MRNLFRNFEASVDRSIGRKNLGYVLLGLLIVYFIWFPNDASQSNYAKTVFISGFFYAILAASWALLAGIAGQFSFGHMAFMGIGAYTAGLLARDGVILPLLGISIDSDSISPIGAIIIGTIVAGLVGLIIGWLVLRLRSSYLALFTIAFSELFRIVTLTEYDYTGGSNGLSLRRLIINSDIDAARITNYYVMFGLFIALMIPMYLIANSRIGMFLRAMREDEDAASALGVNIVFYKILIFVITSMIVGLAGAVFYSSVGSERIIPEQLEILQMSLVIAYAVIGGMESLFGAAAGAFISRYLLESLREVPLPLTITYEGETSSTLLRLGIATVLIVIGVVLERRDSVKQYLTWFRLGYIILAVAVIGSLYSYASEPSTIDTSFWRFAIFGMIMVFTLRYMRNGLLYPIIQWFSGRDVAMRETVSKRNTISDTTDEIEEQLA